MLPNIITEYGAPKTIMLSTMAKLPTSGIPGGFKIVLLYPDQGVLINYTMQMQVVGNNIIGCPSNAHVELELYPAKQEDLFFELLGQSNWSEIIKNTYKPIENVTTISQDDFVRLFSKPTNQCISTPASLWPTPD